MSEARSVGAVILAAGLSSRYGSPKQLAVLDGRTLLEHVLSAARAAGLDPVVAVVPVWLPRPAGDGDDLLRWIRNPFPERGMGLSLRLGFGALGDEPLAAVILLGDQPGVSAERIGQILAARGERPFVAAVANGVPAPPILVERSRFATVAALRGDEGLRQLLRDHAELVTAVAVPSHPDDVDAPADLERLAGR